MVQVNLIPDVVQNRRRDAKVRQWATAALATWVIIAVVAVVLSVAYKAYEARRLTDAQNNFTKLDADVNSKDNVAKRTEALSVQTSLGNLSQLFDNQSKLTVVLARLLSLTPHFVIISGLSVDPSGVISISASANAPQNNSYLEAGKFEAALKQSAPGSTVSGSTTTPLPLAANANQGYFTNVQLAGVSQDGKGVVTVNLTAQWNKPGTQASAGYENGVTK